MSAFATLREDTLLALLRRDSLRLSAGLPSRSSPAFTMRLLHYRRTFVEKMFAIHGKVELLKRDDCAAGAQARHSHDLAQLILQARFLRVIVRDDEDDPAIQR